MLFLQKDLFEMPLELFEVLEIVKYTLSKFSITLKEFFF